MILNQKQAGLIIGAKHHLITSFMMPNRTLAKLIIEAQHPQALIHNSNSAKKEKKQLTLIDDLPHNFLPVKVAY
jgi:hypothetical protein